MQGYTNRAVRSSSFECSFASVISIKERTSEGHKVIELCGPPVSSVPLRVLKVLK